MIAAGKLNKRVTLRALGAGQDAAGQLSGAWADVATVWAEMRDISGREFIGSGGVQNETQTRVFIRRRADVVPAMRVLHGAVTYHIDAVLEQENGLQLLACRRLS